MKNKLLFCLVSGSFLLMNCSSDDRFDEPVKVKEKKLLLSKISTVYYDNPENPETTISTLTYNDKGEMVKSNSEDGISVFEYDTDGKPLKALYYNNNIFFINTVGTSLPVLNPSMTIQTLIENFLLLIIVSVR